MINFKFIQSLEGFETRGYVPMPDGGAIESGVTIASGFDIGQRSIEEIDDAFGYELADKLAPYCGVTGHNATKLIKEFPLELSKSECVEINKYAHKRAVELLVNDWSKENTIPFAALNPATQTVIASVAFQYGDLPTRTPKFWRQAANQDYSAMLDNLLDFKDRFGARRRKEARYLFEALNQYGELKGFEGVIS